jgi:hypothetical protein
MIKSIKRDLKTRPTYDCRCDERLETKDIFIYYESTKRKLKTKYICGCRCYERLQTKTKEFTRLSYTELVLKDDESNSCLLLIDKVRVKDKTYV